MKWKKFTLETTTDAVDYLGSMFDDIGIEGMEIEDNVPLTESETKGMFIDILPELPPDDGTARVSFYLDEDEDTEEKLKAVREGLEEIRQFVNIGTAKITESETDDKDWINNWKQYFKPFTVDDILIKPTWETIPEEHKDKLLILAANDIPEEKFGVIQGNIIDDKATQDAAGYECYDIVVANILADIIIMIQKQVPFHLKKGGIFISSGIIDMKEQAVREALEANEAFEIIEVTRQGEWVSFTARKK